MKVSPEELETIIVQLKNENFIFISLDQLVDVLHSPQKKHQKFIVITLDDGYRDNVEFAYPLFKKYDVPFCIYITNSFPNKTTNLWWYALESLILQNDSLTTENKRRSNRSDEEKKKNFWEFRDNILNHHFYDPLKYFRSMGVLSFDLEEHIAEKCLTWDEIKNLSKDSLVTIGCHTVNHFPLSKLSLKEAEYEIIASKQEVEEHIGKKVRHFAFPFGTRKEAGIREYRLAEKAGFDTVTTTIHGHVSNNDSAYSLKRIFLFPLANNNYTLKKLMFWNIRTYYYWFKKILRLD